MWVAACSVLSFSVLPRGVVVLQALGRAGLCKERICGKKERTDCSPVAGMNMEMRVILRMNDSHVLRTCQVTLSVSAVGIVLNKVKLFSVLPLGLTWIYLIKHLSFYTV